MTSIKKIKKIKKSFFLREWYDVRWRKRLKTRYKSREFHVYTLVSCDGSMFLLDIHIRTKSKRKRGKHEKKIL